MKSILWNNNLYLYVAVPGIIGSLQALEAIKIASGMGCILGQLAVVLFLCIWLITDLLLSTDDIQKVFSL